MNAPNEEQLAAVEDKLRGLPRGSQRAVGGSVYMRLDGEGRRRFQIRVRTRDGHEGRTFETWEQANAGRTPAEAPAGAPTLPPPTPAAAPPLPANFEFAPGPGDVVGPTIEEIRSMTFSEYRLKVYWPWATHHLDPRTRSDYRRKLRNDVEPIIGGYTLVQLAESLLLVDHFKDELSIRKVAPRTRIRKGKKQRHPKAGQVLKAACDGAITAASSVAEHALAKEVISRNPFQGIARFNRQKTSRGSKNASYRRVKPSEVMHPRVVAQVGAGVRPTRNHWQTTEKTRALFDAVAYGWRPSDLLGTRHHHWRDKDGAKRYAQIRESLKDIDGVQLLGAPKTGERDLELFGALAWQFERVYQSQGRPPLDHLLVPNAHGGFLNLQNLERDRWYPALVEAGFIDEPDSEAIGAFDLYLLRHIGVTTMSHAQRPRELGGGSYSPHEVAARFGHTVETMLRTYVEIPADMHGIAGMTMDEIIWNARREIYGPMPIDPDFDDRFYTVTQAAELIGVDPKKLGASVGRRSIPATLEGGRYLISEFDLVWLGLLDPAIRRR